MHKHMLLVMNEHSFAGSGNGIRVTGKCLGLLDGKSDTLATTNAEGSETLLAGVLTEEGVDEGNENTGTTGTDGVAESDGTTVDVDLAGVKAELLADTETLGGESLVGLNTVEVVDGPSGASEGKLGGRDGAHTHDAGVDTGRSVADDAGKDGGSHLLSSLSRGDDKSSSTIVNARSVTGSHGTVLLEGRAELAKASSGGTSFDELILVEDHRVSAALGNADRHDLLLEEAGSLGLLGAVLASGGEGVLVLTGDAVLLRDVLGGDAHVVIVHGAGETISDHGVLKRPGAHTLAVAAVGENVRALAHVLHTTGNNDISKAELHRLGGKHDGLETTATDLVDGHRGHGDTETGGESGLASRVLANAGLENVAHDDLVHSRAVDLGAGKSLADHGGTKSGGTDTAEGTAEVANGGTACRHDDCFLAGHLEDCLLVD
mmetsp:Transcript_22059/g.43386  ORF Transcript_22059/g.43386 Transcript_22059/m.43386 type:complete len:433 (-) Transcript_22059:141-1439(-)